MGPDRQPKGHTSRAPAAETSTMPVYALDEMVSPITTAPTSEPMIGSMLNRVPTTRLEEMWAARLYTV